MIVQTFYTMVQRRRWIFARDHILKYGLPYCMQGLGVFRQLIDTLRARAPCEFTAEASAEVMGRASQQATSNDFLDEKRLRFSNTVWAQQ